MDETRELACRVERLERSNNRLRAILIGAILLAGIVVLMGSSSNQSPSVLEAQKFVLKDAAGHERGSLFATDSSWGLVLYNPDSSKGAAFIVSGFGSAAMLMNKKGGAGIAAMASEEASTLAVTDLKTNRTAIELTNNGQGSLVRFLDGNGIDRVTIGLSQPSGAALLLNDAGSRMRTVLSESYPGLSTFDAEGSFVWAAGFDGFSKEEQKAMRVRMQKSVPRR